MRGLARRSAATAAIVAAVALMTPALASASSSTTSTTTTIVVKTTAITTLKQYRAAEKIYLARLNVINVTFLDAVATAKTVLNSALANATNATARISARATYRYAIAEATISRSNALTKLGKPPVKPGKTPTTTTTF